MTGDGHGVVGPATAIGEWTVPGQLEPPPNDLVAFIVIATILASAFAVWIYRDATARGSAYPREWAVGLVVLFLAGVLPGLVGLGAYLWVRGERRPEAD